MGQYEIVIIFTPILSDDELNREVKKYKDFLKQESGEVVSEEAWGLKQLAYTVDKKTTGIYFLMEFKVDGSFILKLETQLKRDEHVMRWLITALDKDAVAYNARRRDKKRTAEEKSRDEKLEKEIKKGERQKAITSDTLDESETLKD